MNKIMIGLSLLASVGLSSISTQALAGERRHQGDNHNYAYTYNQHQDRGFRKGYRAAKREQRKHRRQHRKALRHHHAKTHYKHARHERRHHDNSRRYDKHARIYQHPDYNWRVIFKF